jgi:pimeloyl-ACP methyl ester carboxylesterase
VGWALLTASGCALVHDIQRGTLFRPEQARADESVAGGIEGLERWWLDVEGGRVEAWYLPPRPPRAEPGPALIFAHGNAELVEDWAERLEPYRAMGFAVLLPEYRGYGRSGGTPSEPAILADFERFYDRLVDRPEVDPRRVAFHGRSLGGGVVGVLSGRRRAAALVLESTFTNVPDVASEWLAPSMFIVDRFDTREVLLRSSTPVLILHGIDDDVIPFKHARELDRVAWESRVVAYRAGHDLPRTEQAYWRPIRELLIESGVAGEPAPEVSSR